MRTGGRKKMESVFKGEGGRGSEGRNSSQSRTIEVAAYIRQMVRRTIFRCVGVDGRHTGTTNVLIL